MGAEAVGLNYACPEPYDRRPDWMIDVDGCLGDFCGWLGCIPRFPGGTDGAKSLGGFRGGFLRLSWLSLGGFGVATPWAGGGMW